jgi:hypothetical protein
MLPVDPRDLISEVPDDLTTCVANNLTPEDVAGPGELASWILGDVFLKS